MAMQLNRAWTGIVVVAGAVALSACAATAGVSRPPVTETLAQGGVSASRVSIDTDGALHFRNADEKPHQIYSNDCPELSSTIIEPGQSYQARLGQGPKTCHFEDLLDPLTPGFWGTVDVAQPPVSLEASAG